MLGHISAPGLIFNCNQSLQDLVVIAVGICGKLLLPLIRVFHYNFNYCVANLI